MSTTWSEHHSIWDVGFGISDLVWIKPKSAIRNPTSQILPVVRSLTIKAPHCECGNCRFKSGRSTQTDLGCGISDFGFEVIKPKSEIRIPKSQFQLGPWQKGVCTSLSTKTMTVRVRSVPPNIFWILDFGFWIGGRSFRDLFCESKIQNLKSKMAPGPLILFKENITMFALKSRNIRAT